MFSNRDKLDQFVHTSPKPPVAIVAAGGDGTVGNVANRLPGLPIAILPLGTENLLAKYLKVPRDGANLADIIAAGKTVTLDSAMSNDQRFLIMAGFGLDAAVVHRMDEVRTGTISHLSYIQPILRTFRKYEYVPLRVYLDDQPEPLVGHQVMIVNLPAYALGMPFAASATGSDGLLDVRVFDGASSFQMVKYCYKVARKKHEQSDGVLSATAKVVRVEADEPAFAQVDGDPAGFTPATVKVQPASVTYFVP
jgi:diacylglycerol kinase family enzyme